MNGLRLMSSSSVLPLGPVNGVTPFLATCAAVTSSA